MLNLKIYTSLKLIFIVCLISIISAYFIEYALGHKPCNLCLVERVPYLLCIILIILNYFFLKNEKFLILLLILVFIFSLGISVYHFGIEQGFFEESSICGVKNTFEIITKEELLNQLNENIISCKDVTFRIFGFSLTTFNIVISIILVISLLNIFRNYEKFKK